MTAENYKRTKYTCYYTYLAMSSIFSLPPILFLTFHERYGISFTLLGTLVLINFCSQLAIDLIFSFFAKYFPMKKTICAMPLLTSLGLLVYSLVPRIAPRYAYAGLVAGTVIFSIAAGLCEVLLSPTVAALPSENPERDMSALHSLYAYGVLGVVLVSTLYLAVFGAENWMYLGLFFSLLPFGSFFSFCTCEIPEINISQDAEKGGTPRKKHGFFLCVLCIFLGSSAENAMTNWISGYVENVLQISKTWGDILGMALFAVFLGLARTLYARFGKHIFRVLLAGMAGAVVCYLAAGLSSSLIVALLACIATGFCTSMLWPGTLLLMEEKFPHPGVAAYALMAAGGDLGGSVAPQLLGAIADKVSAGSWAAGMSASLSLSPEQIGMRAGMLIAAIFPLLGVLVLLVMKKYFAGRKATEGMG